MMSISKIYILAIGISLMVLFMFSCNLSLPGKPLYNPAYVLDSFSHFWKYWYYHVRLAQDYEVFKNNKRISQKEFLKKLTTGNYLPLKLKSEDSTTDQYRLIKIKNLDNKKDIRRYISFFGNMYLKYLNMEGKPISKFSFHALNGEMYTNNNCKGNYVVLDCWFVGCKACVEEMPELNELVEKYSEKDIIFIGLALNSKKDLKRFLTKVKLKYTVVPKMRNFMRDSLNIIMYPTYIVVNKKGNIVSFSNYIKDLKAILKQKVEAGRLSGH